MIRKDGLYITHFKDRNLHNELVEVSEILFFTKNDHVWFHHEEGYFNPEKITIAFLDKNFDAESKLLGQYKIMGTHINISYPLNNNGSIIKDMYLEFDGKISENELILDYNNCFWNETKNDYSKLPLNKKLIFKFYPLFEKKYIDKEPEIKSTSFKKFDPCISNISDFKNNEIKAYNKNRNIAIAFFFGFFGAIIGVIFGGFLGFIAGAIFGVIIGFVLKLIID